MVPPGYDGVGSSWPGRQEGMAFDSHCRSATDSLRCWPPCAGRRAACWQPGDGASECRDTPV